MNEPKYTANFSAIRSYLNSTYPVWKDKLSFFFPYAPSEFIKNPIPEMLLLLSEAFGYRISDEDKKELEIQIKKACSGEGEASDETNEQKESEDKESGQGSGKSEEGENKQNEGDGKQEGKGQEQKKDEEGQGQNQDQNKQESKDQSKGQSQNQSKQESKGQGQEQGQGKQGEKPSTSSGSSSRQSEETSERSLQQQALNVQNNSKGDEENPFKRTREQLRQEFLKNLGEKESSTLDLVKESPLQYLYADTEGHEQINIKPTVDFALSNLFKKRLLAEARNKTVSNLEEGELDGHELIGAYSGRRDVFERYERGKSNKIAFVIALDHSGSMRGCREKSQAIASINIMAAIDKLRIPNAIISFGRECGYIRLFEDYSEWLPPRGSSGRTNPEKAYYHAINLLKRRQEKRKIFLIISDGALYPGKCVTYRQEAEMGKIETYAFTVGYDVSTNKELKQVYDNIVCHDESGHTSLEESLYRYMDDLFQYSPYNI